MYPSEAIDVPETLPADVDTLCRLIREAGPDARLFAALGDALVEAGEPGLAYRAYDKAQRMGHEGDLQAKKDRLDPVPRSVIEAEEREAEAWVKGLQAYERERIAKGLDPRDLEPFYERYGRPEESLARRVRVRQTAFWSGALASLLALAFAIGSGRLRRRAAAVAIALAALCLLGPLLGGPRGPYLFGAIALGTAAALVQWRGRAAA